MTTLELPFDDEQSDEDAPLLLGPQPTVSRFRASICHQINSPRIITFILFIIIFMLASGGSLMAIPALRFYEDVICHHYYADLQGEGHIWLGGDIDEDMCKGEEVQNQLNILVAGIQFLNAGIGLFVTVPYGLLADRIGRKLVLILSICGMFIGGCWNLSILYFWRVLPIRLLWLSPLSSLLGGGDAVCSMVFYAIGCDITTEANRANLFLLGRCAGLLAELIAPPVASALMPRSLWIPLLLGMTLMGLAVLPATLIPETLHLRVSRMAETSLDLSSEPRLSLDTGAAFFTAIKTRAVDGLKTVHASASVLRSLPVLLLLITFIVNPFARQSIELALLYISKRFSWELSQVGFLLSLRAFVNFILLLIIVPAVSHYMTEGLYLSPTAKDLFLARASAILLVVGALLIAASSTVVFTIVGLVVWSLGTGFDALSRSLITTLVDREHIAQLYAAISIVETAGALAAGPTLAGLYSLGLKWKGAWTGLPFFGLATISFAGGLGVWCFGFLMKKQAKQDMPYGDEDGEAILGETLFSEGDTGEPGITN